MYNLFHKISENFPFGSDPKSPSVFYNPTMSTGKFLSFEPQEIRIPFELDKIISCSLQVSNKTDDSVAFKVKTTNRKKYAVKPNTGVILPRSTCDVVVTMEKQLEAPPGLHCKDKFMFQSVIATPGATTEKMFNKEAGNLIEQYKLNVFYVSPNQNPSPNSKASEERSSPSEKGNMNSSDDTATSRGSNETEEKSSEKVADGSSSSIEISLGELERKKMKRYSSGELTSITEKFTNEIGSGAYGDVFKGTLPNGLQVAVKKLKDTAVNVMEFTFMAEVKTMSSTSHRNLVRLYGYCFEANMKALVYEYLENGSLDDVLYENHLNLRWEILYEIAIGTAKGLSYLHESCDDEIVHYDVKPGNVLLDSKLSPKVADFGMAKISQRDLSHISVIEFRGTRSYAAPEMWMQMPVTPKSDIYSFGMMLFEILRRGRNLDGKNWFPGQVWEKFKKEKLDEIMEECGIEDKNKVKARILSTTALWCTQYKADDRPTMSVVVQVLKGNIQLKSPPDPLYPYSVSSGTSSWGGGSTQISGPLQTPVSSIVSSTSI